MPNAFFGGHIYANPPYSKPTKRQKKNVFGAAELGTTEQLPNYFPATFTPNYGLLVEKSGWRKKVAWGPRHFLAEEKAQLARG